MSTHDWYRQMRAEEKEQRDRLPTVKAQLCDALKTKRIAMVSIAYDGEGDSGQINHIEAFDKKRQPVSLDQPVTLALHKPEEPTCYRTLYEALEDFAWMALRVYHAGFEINDGGFGTITIGANTAKIAIDHNERLTDIANTFTEV